VSFAQQLEVGKIGESQIARWFNRRGFHVLPVYEKEVSEGKGPTLFLSDGSQKISPDLLVFRGSDVYWIEAKHKTAFSWHRKTRRWVTGIDIRHYSEYLEVKRLHPEWDIWLMFLHKNGTAKDTPNGMVSPSGLFCGELGFLRENENHRHANWGRSGMVYWSSDVLKKIATLEQME